MKIPGRCRPGIFELQLKLFLFYAVCQRVSKTTRAAISALVCRDVARAQAREAFQLNRGLPTIQTNVGVATADRDVVMALQVGQRLAFQVKLVVA